jgi:hypothetical protein
MNPAISCRLPCRAMPKRERRYWMLLALLCIANADAAIYQVTTTADSGVGSLRQAITDANATPAVADEIHFAIPGAGPHVINVLTQLPFVTSTVTIDGFTQAGASANTLSPSEGGLNTVLKISLTGPGVANGLVLNSPNSVVMTVQGLNIYGCGICLRGDVAGTSQIRSFGNFICTNIAGDVAANTSQSTTGIRGVTQMVIGGELPWQRNLISGCTGTAVLIAGNADIRGNLIGTDRTGTIALGNGSDNNWPGLYITNVLATITIGGTNTNARNIVSGNSRSGIAVNRTTGAGAYASTRIVGNFIGTDWQGAFPLPNGYTTVAQARFGGGIRISGGGITDTTPLIIGGFLPGEGNLIAFNNGSGITTSDVNPGASPGAAFESRGNVIHSNTFGGATNIDLGGFGRSANDVGDLDVGTNDVQNYPEILSATEQGGIATVRYRVDTLAANASYPLRIDFYRALNNGSSGRLLAQDNYPASLATQIREFSFPLPPNEFAMPITAIASNAGRSSEMAPVLDVLFDTGFE